MGKMRKTYILDFKLKATNLYVHEGMGAKSITHELAIALGISYSRDIEDRGSGHQILLPRSTNKTAELCERFYSIGADSRYTRSISCAVNYSLQHMNKWIYLRPLNWMKGVIFLMKQSIKYGIVLVKRRFFMRTA
ncbi:hypothetical protein L2D08_19340 [Domibacillus sp. PGB-M46]|uniref:hypothetical protein n=1 Tax=Domibacillus sp. PGB-M46 TaxID=2910255 RepID=UPI001F58D4D5|nr:hypothetical protein [Domibacillus sp. PGB-M46]MCI2256497.1 hypothetical protein [Domibacillus sp. PGB-M46]